METVCKKHSGRLFAFLFERVALVVVVFGKPDARDVGFGPAQVFLGHAAHIGGGHIVDKIFEGKEAAGVVAVVVRDGQVGKPEVVFLGLFAVLRQPGLLDFVQIFVRGAVLQQVVINFQRIVFEPDSIFGAAREGDAQIHFGIRYVTNAGAGPDGINTAFVFADFLDEPVG